jgi:hypothetical protein
MIQKKSEELGVNLKWKTIGEKTRGIASLQVIDYNFKSLIYSFGNLLVRCLKQRIKAELDLKPLSLPKLSMV